MSTDWVTASRKINAAGYVALAASIFLYRFLGEILPDLAADIIGPVIVVRMAYSVTGKRMSREKWVELGLMLCVFILLKRSILGRW
jgi:hypothetical protein